MSQTDTLENSFSNASAHDMEPRQFARRSPLPSDLKSSKHGEPPQFQEIILEVTEPMNEATVDASVATKNLSEQYAYILNQIQMDQILLRDKYEIFPR